MQTRMSPIYQPVMIKTLLENGSQTTTQEIAEAYWLTISLKWNITQCG